MKPSSDFPVGGLAGADDPLLISTRRPTAPNYAVHGNPDERLLLQSGDAMRASPDAFAKNMEMLAEEPFMSRVGSTNPDKIYEYGLRQGADNLKFIANDLMSPEKAAASRRWYPVAHEVSGRFARDAGYAPEAGFGVTAVTSPQTPWDINVAKMDRLFRLHRDGYQTPPEEAVRWMKQRMENMREPGAVASKGEDWIRRIAETPMDQLPKNHFDRYGKVVLSDALNNDPAIRQLLLSGEYGAPAGNITWGSGKEINKALNILDDPSMANIARQMEGGGKVPSFFDNIAAPFSKAPVATIDTHSGGALSLFPGGGKDPIVYRAMGIANPAAGTPPSAASPARTGAKGLYGHAVDMHALAGKELGFRPNETQSVTWEGVRDLWGNSGKTQLLKDDIANIHRSASSPDAARVAIAERLGKPVRRVYAVNKKAK